MSVPGRFGRKIGVLTGGVLVAGGALFAGTVLANASQTRIPHRTAAQLLAHMRTAKPPAAMSATISETANLGLPTLPDIPGLSSSSLSAASLLTGTHTAQIWYSAPRRLRVAVPAPFGEVDLRVNGKHVWLWNSRTQTATRYVVPARPSARRTGSGQQAAPEGPAGSALAGMTPSQAARRILALAGPTTKITVAGTVTVANRPAYQLAVSPKTGGSLISRILIAVDAQTYLPLQIQVFARGGGGPAFQFGYTSLTLGQPGSSNFSFTPPAGAHVKTAALGGKAAGRTPAGAGQEPSSGQKSSAGKTGALAAGVRVIGKGWLSVLTVPAAQARSLLSGAAGQGPGGQGSAAYRSNLTITGHGGQASGQGRVLYGSLMKAATTVHGWWGTGRLLRTSLVSVLITSKGTVLIGPVTPRVLYADAAKAS